MYKRQVFDKAAENKHLKKYTDKMREAFDIMTEKSFDIPSEKAASRKLKTIKIGGNEVCAKTGLPANKVYVDENGEIQLKDRKYASSDDKVGGFMNAKIFI